VQTDPVGYSAIHYRARKALPKRCALEDDTCSKTLHVALRKDAEGPFLYEGRFKYSLALPERAYVRLCVSHHYRYDGRQVDWSAIHKQRWANVSAEEREAFGSKLRDDYAMMDPEKKKRRAKRISETRRALGYRVGSRREEATA